MAWGAASIDGLLLEERSIMKVLLVLLLTLALSWKLARPLTLEESREGPGDRLLAAASAGDEIGMRRAWAAGAPIDYRDSARSTSLTYVAFKGDVGAARWLLEHGNRSPGPS